MLDGPTPTDLMSMLRLAELERARVSFPEGNEFAVLEIGGGNGFQARWLQSWGYRVSAVDVEVGSWVEQFAPVELYDGTRLPFPSEAFNVVFSSNVLEHVANLHELLSETHRVLKPDGIAIHTLPTPAWRFWTSVAHYPWCVNYAIRRGGVQHGKALPTPTAVLRRRGALGAALRVLFPPPHGVGNSSYSELVAFSRGRWCQIFDESGFQVIDDYPAGVFYTGYSLFPSLTLSARAQLARWLGSGCRVYVLRKPDASGHVQA